MLDTATPKLNAVASVRRDITEKLATGNLLPATFAATSPDICTGGMFIGAGYLYLGQGGACGFLVNVPASGSYALTLSVGTYYSATQAAILVDQAAVGNVAIPSTGGNLTDWTNTMPLTLSLTAGLHVISVSASGGAFGVQSVSAAGQ